MLYPYEYYKNGTLELPSENPPESDIQHPTIRFCSFHRQWIIWRIVSGVMGLFFFAAAYVQHNDPDPYLWMPVYLIPCIISWAVAFGLTLKVYKSLPSENSSRSSTPVPGNVRMPTGKQAKSASPPLKLDASVIVPKYGSANKKMDWIITCHVVFCFALGIYTLVVHLAGIRTGLESKVMRLSETQDNQSHLTTSSISYSTEEAKELMGLCVVIAWLSLLRHSNYVLLGRTGLSLGIAMMITPIIAWVAVEVFEGDSGYHQC